MLFRLLALRTTHFALLFRYSDEQEPGFVAISRASRISKKKHVKFYDLSESLDHNDN